MSEFLSFYAADLVQIRGLFVASIPGRTVFDASSVRACLKNDAR